jgi:hypothetical protein
MPIERGIGPLTGEMNKVVGDERWSRRSHMEGGAMRRGFGEAEKAEKLLEGFRKRKRRGGGDRGFSEKQSLCVKLWFSIFQKEGSFKSFS